MQLPNTTTAYQTAETKYQIEEPRDTSDPSGAESQPTSTKAGLENESSAAFLEATRKDLENGGGSGEPGKTSSEPPKSGQKFGPLLVPGTHGRPARESGLSQPVREQVPAPAPEVYEERYDAATLQRLVDKTDPYPRSKPSVREHDLAAEKGIPAFRRYPFSGPNQDQGEGGVPGNVSKKRKNQPGFLPTDEKRVKAHPAYADYKERRPEQILSHFSSVMLHQQNKRRSGPDREVEVQYGYFKDDKGNLRLYSSANSLKGQRWLRDNSSGSQLLDHVRKAAMSNKEDVSRHARKLLFFEENQKERKNEIRNDKNLTEKDRSRLLKDLEDADKIHKEFFTGTHHVVTNTVAERRRQPKDDKRFQRHAEQNVVEQMHRDVSKGVGEIAGTKIRCGSCNVELGASVEDSKERYKVGGMLYPGQSETDKMRDAVAANDDKGRPKSMHSPERGQRSQSRSPDPTRQPIGGSR